MAYSDVSSTTGNIQFSPNNLAPPTMVLNATGLGVHTQSLPQANLHVNGSAIFSQLSVGSHVSSQANLSTPSIAFSHQSSSSNTAILNHSYLFVDSSSANVTVTLPSLNNIDGRMYCIKKTSSQNSVWIHSNGNLIDGNDLLILPSGNMGAAKLIANSGNWSMLSSYRTSPSLASSNLALWLDFEQANTAPILDKASGFTVTKNGLANISSSNSIIGQGAMFFDGIDDHLEVPDHQSLDFTTELTVSFWVYQTQSASEATHDFMYLAKRTDTTDQSSLTNDPHPFRIWQRGSDDKVRVQFGTVIGYRGALNSTSTLSKNQWNHIAVLFTQEKAYLYINGILNDNTSFSAAVVNGNLPLNIGAFTSTTSQFHGWMDEIKFYNSALTTQELLLLYQSGQ